MDSQHKISKNIFKILDQRWVGSSDIEKILFDFNLPEEQLGAKIYLINQVLNLVRAIPDPFFKDNSHRENIFEVLQDTLDDLIDQEEAEDEFFDIEL